MAAGFYLASLSIENKREQSPLVIVYSLPMFRNFKNLILMASRESCAIFRVFNHSGLACIQMRWTSLNSLNPQTSLRSEIRANIASGMLIHNVVNRLRSTGFRVKMIISWFHLGQIIILLLQIANIVARDTYLDDGIGFWPIYRS